MSAKTEIDWKELNAMLQFDITCKYCAEYMGVSEDAIQRRIREDFDMTFKEYNRFKMQRTAVKLQQKAIEMAIKGNTTMMIFALKNLANWSDKNETAISIDSFEFVGDDEDE